MKIVGAFEQVRFPLFDGYEVVAKIDTGAYTGALHCTDVYEEETPAGSVLHFSPFDNPQLKLQAVNFTTSMVRSSNGEEESRYFITTQIELQGKTYPILITLADRSEMKWPVLIGRRFLRAHHFLVDVSQGAQYGEQVKD